MSGSVNKAIIVGNLGSDPEVRQAGGKPVANFSVATSETWKDKQGDLNVRTQWHRVTVWGPQAEIAGKYLKKGSKVYLEGQIQTRSYEKDGQTKYVTEIVLQGFNSTLAMLDARQDGEQAAPQAHGQDPDIPF
jgi:single-strand DNA-binding protein